MTKVNYHPCTKSRGSKKNSTITEEFNLSQHEKAIRLVEGGFVWHNGHYIGAKKVISKDEPCFLCNMDSICDLEMTDLCGECECLTHDRYLLYLVSNGDNLDIDL